MSRHRQIKPARAYVYGSMFNLEPPDEEDDPPEDEGGMDALQADGFDLSCDEAPGADEHAADAAADRYQRDIERNYP